MMKINGMYGFHKATLGFMIQGFNICLESTGIEQAVEECWATAEKSENPIHNARYAEIAAWALERAITLRDRG